MWRWLFMLIPDSISGLPAGCKSCSMLGLEQAIKCEMKHESNKWNNQAVGARSNVRAITRL